MTRPPLSTRTGDLLKLLAIGQFLGLAVAAARPAAGEDASPAAIEFFEKKIRPILVEHCLECHGADAQKVQGGLSIEARDSLLKGGDSGPAIVPGDAEKSLLIRAVRQTDKDLQMPPKPAPKLAATQIADLEAWVKMGAPDPRQVASPKEGPPRTAARYGVSLEEGRKFWSLQPVVDHRPPPVQDAAWPRTPLDHFLRARQEAAGIAPAPDADKRTLLRRLTFDLTGLPPTPAEMEAFLADDSPQAFAHVVDRLLDSPRYGERWGRHWLDVVRYADTSGNASDYPVPQAYKYRDWVIRAFNRDLPYDQFLREQIAGDLLGGDTEGERRERILATGYLAISRRFGGSRTGEHHLTLEDTIDNLGRAILGSTISCARCHDHKFDPFTMSDYYGLYGIFESTRYPFPGAEAAKTPEDFVPLMSATEIETILKPHREQVAALEEEIKLREAAVAETKKAPDAPEKQAAVDAAAKALADAIKKRNELKAQAPVLDDAYAVAEAKAANTKVQKRGDPKRLGDEVPRHFPAVLGGQELPAACATSGRRELAEWLTDPRNPLTARVMVNRIWQHHFGKGIVQTPNDFGRQGKPPTHPELLDYLAARFVESGWSVKAMHKMMLLSHAWQVASSDVPENARRDPGNDLFWKFERRRLDAESIRDALLVVGGGLEENANGGHPFPPQPSWGFTQHNPFFANYESRRRSVYLMQQRLRKNPYLALFDGADPSSSTAVRLPSTTPLQALFLMNSSVAHAEAAKFAERLMTQAGDDVSRVNLAYQLALTRPPTPDEQDECAAFLRSYRAKLEALKTPAGQLEPKTWEALARAVISSNEFVYVD